MHPLPPYNCLLRRFVRRPGKNPGQTGTGQGIGARPQGTYHGVVRCDRGRHDDAWPRLWPRSTPPKPVLGHRACVSVQAMSSSSQTKVCCCFCSKLPTVRSPSGLTKPDRTTVDLGTESFNGADHTIREKRLKPAFLHRHSVRGIVRTSPGRSITPLP